MAKVLLVDDELALRSIMERQLVRGGNEVVVAGDGLAAIEILEREEFEVVVSDMQMPRLDGMGLLARARVIAPNMEFIILTGHGSMLNAVEAFKTGTVFDYILKPLEDIHELNAVVTRAYERHRLRRDLEEARAQLAFQAERDGLTGLFNHRTIHAKLGEVLKDETVAELALIMLDMDGFKSINDAFGHPIGDKVLKHVAAALTEVCLDSYHCGRCGGDEFMVILPEAAAVRAENVATQIRKHLSENQFVAPDGANLPLKLCFGIVDSSEIGRSAARLVAAADSALYASKGSGGDVTTIYGRIDENNELINGTAFDVMDRLIAEIDGKDNYTRAHSEEVTDYALQLGQALGISEETSDALRLAGLLHDVGKIGVPSSILRKSSNLTPEEHEIVKGHVNLSTLIIHGIPRLNDIIEAVGNHHECWDGSGYPNGFAGEQIPLLGRILAIANRFSSLTSKLSDRPGLSTEQALCEIEAGAGTVFDPSLVPVFVNLMRRDSTQMRAA